MYIKKRGPICFVILEFSIQVIIGVKSTPLPFLLYTFLFPALNESGLPRPSKPTKMK